MGLQLLALSAAFVVAVALTPMFRRLSLKLGIIDAPDAHRKLHREAVALCGGPVVLSTVMIVLGIGYLFTRDFQIAWSQSALAIGALVLGCFAIVALGLLDDRFGLRGRQKLIGQLLIASGLVACGYRITSVHLLGIPIEFGILSFAISVGWLLLTINSINLIDGADGLCCSVGWIACAGFAAMATIQGHTVQAAFAAAVAGALLGFLVFNFPPAKVFLGDSGSMLVGLVLGALAIRASLKSPTAVSMFGAVAILALPIFDSSMAIVRRKLTGRSIFSTDRGHLHHSLITKGFAQSKLVYMVSLLSGVLATGAFLSSVLNSEVLSLISVLVVIGCLVISRMFGHSELKLLASRIKFFVLSLVPSLRRNESALGKQIHCRLQGDRSWERIWDSLVEFADKHDLSKVCLDLNVPWLHEGYHACWNRDKAPEEIKRWKTQMPIFADERPLGRIEIIGGVDSTTVTLVLEELAMLIDSIQAEVLMVIHGYGISEPIPSSPTVLAREDESVAEDELATPMLGNA